MKEKLRLHIATLFEEAPKTKRSTDLQEELFANLIERYNDLVSSGMTEDESYKNVISNIGDVSELTRNLKENDVMDFAKVAEDRKKSALMTTIAVSIYFVGFLLFMGFIMFTGLYEIGTMILFIFAAAGTILLVYNAASKPKYQKYDDTVVENFKEWNSNHDKMKGLRGAISATLWTLIVILYFLVSFMTMAWYITWIIFLIGACIESVISIIFKLRDL